MKLAHKYTPAPQVVLAEKTLLFNPFWISRHSPLGPHTVLHVPAKWGALQTRTQYWDGRHVCRGARKEGSEGRAKAVARGRTERVMNFMIKT